MTAGPARDTLGGMNETITVQPTTEPLIPCRGGCGEATVFASQGGFCSHCDPLEKRKTC